MTTLLRSFSICHKFPRRVMSRGGTELKKWLQWMEYKYIQIQIHIKIRIPIQIQKWLQWMKNKYVRIQKQVQKWLQWIEYKYVQKQIQKWLQQLENKYVQTEGKQCELFSFVPLICVEQSISGKSISSISWPCCVLICFASCAEKALPMKNFFFSGQIEVKWSKSNLELIRNRTEWRTLLLVNKYQMGWSEIGNIWKVMTFLLKTSIYWLFKHKSSLQNRMNIVSKWIPYILRKIYFNAKILILLVLCFLHTYI